MTSNVTYNDILYTCALAIHLNHEKLLSVWSKYVQTSESSYEYLKPHLLRRILDTLPYKCPILASSIVKWINSNSSNPYVGFTQVFFKANKCRIKPFVKELIRLKKAKSESLYIPIKQELQDVESYDDDADVDSAVDKIDTLTKVVEDGVSITKHIVDTFT